MPIGPRNLVRHELIGLPAKVAASSNAADIGQQGMVADETRNTLVITTAQGAKRFAKQDCTFVFALPSGEQVQVQGRLLVARPEDRIKKRLRSW